MRDTVLLAAHPVEELLNPYLRILYQAPAMRSAVAVRGLGAGLLLPAAGVLHLHWPEYLLHGRLARRSAAATDVAYGLLLRGIDRVRRRGGQVVWTAHNLAPHGFPAPHAAAAYRRWSGEIFARVDTVVAMAPSVIAAVGASLPEVAATRFVTIPHPHYRSHYCATAEPAAVRRRLDIPQGAHLMAAVGIARRYKRLPELIAAFAAAARPDEYLLVAGACHDPALAAEISRAAAGVPRLRLLPTTLSDADFAGLVRASDLFVTNFGAALNSGSVLAALSLDRPVIAPRLGAIADLQDQVGVAWLRLFDGDLDAATLRRLTDDLRERRRAARPDLRPNAPERVVAEHVRLYTGRS